MNRYCPRCKGRGLVTKVATIERDDKGKEIMRTYSWVRCPECEGKGVKR